MRQYFSILFAILIFAALSIFARPIHAQAPALTAEEVTLVLRDSDNAHKVAKVALDAVGCILTTLQENAVGTPEKCMEILQPILDNYGQEHMLLHPRLVKMLHLKLEQRDS